MGLKVVKCSDQAYARIALVAAKQETYLADALDLIIFGKVNHEGNLMKGVPHADTRGSQSGTAKRTGRAHKKPGAGAKKTASGYGGIEGLTKD
jgi:hypothetical protein